MAAKHIVFLSLVTVALGSSFFDDCDVSVQQDFDIRECTAETETVDKVLGRYCPQDFVYTRPVCKEV